MRLFNYLPHPNYFFIVAGISFCLMGLTSAFWIEKNDAPITDHLFSWSPDGNKLAMVVEADYSYFRILYLLDADGENLHQLTTKTSDFIHLRWSVDNQILYYGLGPTTGRDETMDWHQINLSSTTENSPAIDPESFPSVTVEDMTANMWTGAYDRFNSTPLANSNNIAPSATSDTHYAIDASGKNCGLPYRCSLHAEIRSIGTDELVWSFDYYERNALYRIIDTFTAPAYFLAMLVSLALGTLVAILRLFKRHDRKQKEKF